MGNIGYDKNAHEKLEKIPLYTERKQKVEGVQLPHMKKTKS